MSFESAKNPSEKIPQDENKNFPPVLLPEPYTTLIK